MAPLRQAAPYPAASGTMPTWWGASAVTIGWTSSAEPAHPRIGGRPPRTVLLKHAERPAPGVGTHQQSSAPAPTPRAVHATSKPRAVHVNNDAARAHDRYGCHTRAAAEVPLTQHPHSSCIGNGAGVGCGQLQPTNCSMTVAAAVAAHLTWCCSSTPTAAGLLPGGLAAVSCSTWTAHGLQREELQLLQHEGCTWCVADPAPHSP